MNEKSPSLLLTPGPLTTAVSTREALQRDWGSRDQDFIELNARVRQQLIQLVDGEKTHTAIPLQGSGTFAVEACLQTFVPPDGKVLIAVNGAYGKRMVTICETAKIACSAVHWAEHEPVAPQTIDDALDADSALTHVAVVHCETTSGILNPIESIADLVSRRGKGLLIDSMSAFGALPLSARDLHFDALMASSNKCLEGVPGLGFVIARLGALSVTQGHARSLSLDLHAQWTGFEKNGQWRFTPPTQVMAGLARALELHAEEGGVVGRGARYLKNCQKLVSGMRALGFQTLLPDALQAPIIVTFHTPKDSRFDFSRFYDLLAERGFIIYPGKLTTANSFRIGCIGQVFEKDIERLLEAVREVLNCLGVSELGPA